MMRNMFSGKSGFSLIEVNMAVLIIGLGLLVLFGLFPAGLQEGDNGIVDTHCALFAETVLEGLRDEVHNNPDLLDWTKWANIGTCVNYFKVQLTGSGTIISGDKLGRIVKGPIAFPAGANPTTYVKYIMQVTGDQDSLTRTVNLWVSSGQYSTSDYKKFKERAEWYATKYFYGEGM